MAARARRAALFIQFLPFADAWRKELPVPRHTSYHSVISASASALAATAGSTSKQNRTPNRDEKRRPTEFVS